MLAGCKIQLPDTRVGFVHQVSGEAETIDAAVELHVDVCGTLTFTVLNSENQLMLAMSVPSSITTLIAHVVATQASIERLTDASHMSQVEGDEE